MKQFVGLLLLAASVGSAIAGDAPGGKGPGTDTRDVRKVTRPLVFVITGESNSGGLGANRAATAAELAPRPCVQIMNLTSGQFQFEDLKIGVNNLRDHRRLGGQHETTCHGFELELANAVAEGAFPGHDRVYLIKTGQGGSHVKDWNEDQQDWKTFVKRIEAGKKQLPQDAQWVVWLSLGINDGRGGNRNFQAAMRPYLDRVSKALPGAPIIMTGFQSMGFPEINKALAELSAERQGVSVIDSTGAKLADSNHWNYDGLKLVTRSLIAATGKSLEAIPRVEKKR